MKYIVGIDEVGRGPLAGPVTVGIVICEEKIYKKLKKDKNLPPLGKDSKKLKEKDREKYAKVLKSVMSKRHFDNQGETSMNHIGISYVVVHVSNIVIDMSGINFAIKKAMRQGIKKLKLDPKNCEVRLDGGLKAPAEFKQKTIIRGDEKEKIIAWASILAKVNRDKLMCKLALKYPKYDLERHKGYGTTGHIKVIQKYGLTSIHRKTFCNKFI